MSEIQTDVSVPALVGVIEANLFAFFLLFQHWPQAEVGRDHGMIWTLTNIPIPLFNSVLNVQFAPGTIDVGIETAITRCRARNVPMLWWTGPSTRPTDLGVSLEAHGFRHAGEFPGMAVDLQELQENISTHADVIIEPVTNSETLKTWCTAFVNGFGYPSSFAEPTFDLFESIGFDADVPLNNYLGWWKGEPVAALTLLRGAGVAGVYNVCTAPHARRQGISGVMVLTALREAKSRGYRIGTLHASQMGIGIYRQLGFQEYCHFTNYLWSAKPSETDAK